jgi:hypothetical protein
MTDRRRRQHATGWAYAGSQRQIQAYVNTSALTAQLDAELRTHLPVLADTALEWKSPLSTLGYAEPRDATFWPAIGRPDLAAPAATWWPPRGGPSWDAIAIAGSGGASAETIVLVEAKANVPEFTAGARGATSPVSIELIDSALDHTWRRLGATAPLDAWAGPYYQLANRLAWALWLRDRSVDTVFAHVLFSDDRSHIPTSGADLLSAAHAGHAALGVPASAIAGWSATIVLAATG